MRRMWAGSAAAMLGMLLRAGAARGQENNAVGVLPAWGVVRSPRVSAEPYAMPAASTYGVLDEMASRASVIFVGTVMRVDWVGGDDGAAGIVAVSFAVEDGIAGPAPGTMYVVKEWAGLWRDAPRYRVGQRRLMLLHAPGPGGLSSPVDGLDGVIPVVGGEALAQAHAQVSGGGAASELGALRADLRWLQAKQMRTVTSAGAPVAGRAELVAGALSGVAEAGVAPLGGGVPQQGVGRVPVAAALAVEANPPLAEVVGRLRGGDGSTHVAR